MAQTQTPTDLVFSSNVSGLTVIPQPTSLTRLNYFDGKFLRADDLQREQEYLRMLIEIANQGGGPGVVYGFDTTLGDGDQIKLGPGMAIDPAGHVLMLPTGTSFGAQDLIDASRRITPVMIAGASGSATFDVCTPVSVSQGTVASGQDFYLLTIGWTEALCGEEDVYGRLCEAACATSTDRPYRVEGVVVRAVPFTPTTPLANSAAVALSATHLRSQLASAFFADEAAMVPSLISKAGLGMDTWCLGAQLGGGQSVPLAVFVRSGTTTLFLDAWTARRERVETPARRYWAWRMMMRPWDAYLAQILQFQCQLHDLILGQPSAGGASDPCKPDIQLLSSAAVLLNDIKSQYATASAALPVTTDMRPTAMSTVLPGGLARLELVRSALVSSLQGLLSRPTNRVLINGGIIELPSAGYLPVDISSTTVNDQVRKLVGEGLDLRFCVVRPDYVAHALEEAEHMDRISLLTGLDQPDAKPKVDILVPNGKVLQQAGATPGTGVSGEVDVNPVAGGGTSLALRGAGRNETLPAGGWAFEFAGVTEAPANVAMPTLIQFMTQAASGDAAGAGTTAATLKTASIANQTNTLSDPNFAVRMESLSMSAGSFLSGLRASTGTLPIFNPAVTTPGQRPAAIWIAFRIEQNPLKLRAGDVTAASVRQILFSPAATVAIHDQRIQGQLQVTGVTIDAGGNAVVNGTFSGMQLIASSATGPTPTASAFNGQVRLTVNYPAGQSPVVDVVVGRNMISPFTDIVRVTFIGSPMTIQATYSAGRGTAAIFPIESATLTVDPMVFSAGNPDQALARAALPILAAGLQDPSFAATAELQLFPTVAPETGEQIIQPTLDWVLFQRRREAACGEPAIVTLPARVYQLYNVLAPDLATQTAIRDALMKPDPAAIAGFVSKGMFVPVDTPQFMSGSTSLSTPAASILADWRTKGPGNLLGWAGIADRLAENTFTDQGRMSAVEQVVATVSKPDAQLASEVMPSTPVQLDVASTDGIIVLITRQQVTTICHTAYRLNFGIATPAQPAPVALFSALAKGDASVLPELFKVATELGSATFNSGSSTPIPGDGIQAKWNAVGAAMPLQAVVLSSNAGADADKVADARTRATQAAAISNEILGNSNIKVVSDLPIASAGIPVGNCPIIDVIVPTLRHHVVAVQGPALVRFASGQIPISSAGQTNPKFVLTQAIYDALIKGPNMLFELGYADFDPTTPTAAPFGSVLQPLSALQKAGWPTANVEAVVALCDASAQPDTVANMTAQVDKIEQGLTSIHLNATGALAQTGPLPSSAGVPVTPVLTLVVVGPLG